MRFAKQRKHHSIDSAVSSRVYMGKPAARFVRHLSRFPSKTHDGTHLGCVWGGILHQKTFSFFIKIIPKVIRNSNVNV